MSRGRGSARFVPQVCGSYIGGLGTVCEDAVRDARGQLQIGEGLGERSHVVGYEHVPECDWRTWGDHGVPHGPEQRDPGVTEENIAGEQSKPEE